MFQLPIMPLAQLNASPGGTASAPAPGAAATTVGPAPAGNPATGVAVAPEGTATSTAPGTATTSAPAPPPSALGQMMPLIMMGLVLAGLYFFMSRGQRKEERRKKSMLADVKKGDRVMTIGGMLASVVSVDESNVVLKIDESNNVKATYRKSAIQEVVDRDDKK